VCLAALSAATFAFNNASARRGVLTGSVAQALAITVPVGVPIFFLAALASGALGALPRFSGSAIGLLMLAGVLHFVVGRYCNFRAAQAIGANLAGPVIQLSLAVSLALAILVLREPLTPLRILGIALLALAPALMRNGASARIDAGTIDPALPKFQPRHAEGYAFALMAALLYGVTPLLIRLAVIGGDLRSGIAGGLVSYLAATAAVALLLLWPGNLRHALAVAPESRKWFGYSGVSVCIAQMFIYMAYAVAPVSVVTMRSSAVGWCWPPRCRSSARSRCRSTSSTCWRSFRCRRRSPPSRAGIGPDSVFRRSGKKTRHTQVSHGTEGNGEGAIMAARVNKMPRGSC
jgi:drug/metabolite transporter (DMT)-like permease